MKIEIEPKNGKWDIKVTRSDGVDYCLVQHTQVEVVKWLMDYLEVAIDSTLRMME
jgi:hypothetical protein